MGRKLTSGEKHILEIVQREYGPKNTEKDVFFTDDDEAAIFVKASDTTPIILVVLTNLAAWREDKTIKDDDELLNKWIRIPHNTD